MISPVRIWRRQPVIRSLLNRRGKIVTLTKIMVPATDFKEFAPYTVALVEFENGDRAMGPVVDSTDTDLRIGSSVTAVLRKIRKTQEDDVIAYGIKFRPVAES